MPTGYIIGHLNTIFFSRYTIYTIYKIYNFQIKNLQSPNTYTSGRTWDPRQKAITK